MNVMYATTSVFVSIAYLNEIRVGMEHMKAKTHIYMP
jgi:hypothetical protein